MRSASSSRPASRPRAPRSLPGRSTGCSCSRYGPEQRLDFEYVTANPASRQAVLFRLVAVAVAASIRADEAKGLIGDFVVTDAVPGDGPAASELDAASRQILATILVMLVFVTSVTYGMWVATSVAEEKSSRVMELMLNAATPGEMLAGKVVGVGGAGLTQLAAIVLPAAIVVALQVPLTRLVLGEDATDAPLAGLTPSILVAFVAFFLLGFVLTALVYAAAGSLVSRQEDVQQVALPMLMISFVAYFAAFFASGAPGAAWVAPLSWIPFFSPYVMLTRLVTGERAAVGGGPRASACSWRRSWWRLPSPPASTPRASCSTASVPRSAASSGPRAGPERPALVALVGLLHHQDRAVGVGQDGVGDAAHHEPA